MTKWAAVVLVCIQARSKCHSTSRDKSGCVILTNLWNAAVFLPNPGLNNSARPSQKSCCSKIEWSYLLLWVADSSTISNRGVCCRMTHVISQEPNQRRNTIVKRMKIILVLLQARNYKSCRKTTSLRRSSHHKPSQKRASLTLEKSAINKGRITSSLKVLNRTRKKGAARGAPLSFNLTIKIVTKVP